MFVANSSVPLSILKKGQDQWAKQHAIREATYDVDRLRKGLRKVKPYKWPPPWSLPAEIWKILLLGHGGLHFLPLPIMRNFSWYLFLEIRISWHQPVQWITSLAACILKHNGKRSCSGFRLVHLLDFVGKAWIISLWNETDYLQPWWSFGFAQHKRREQALLQQRLLQYRLQFVPIEGYWFFVKMDIANAFMSIAKPALYAAIHARHFQLDHERLFQNVLKIQMILVRWGGDDYLLAIPGVGCLPGDTPAPGVF